MSTDLSVCRAGDSVESAEQLMRSKQFRRLPVVDDERRVVGILSLADIVRAAGKQRASGRREIPADEVTATLVDICQPRQVGAARPGPGA
jgi:CBS domain-containing protein